MNFILTHWVSTLTLQEFVKNPDAPCCVFVLVNGIAINGERRLAGHAGISHKSMFNCGFQDVSKRAIPMNDKLETYRSKRDFHSTREPSGNSGRRKGGRRFVIQKHDASRLHYDFRLEIDGVLVSWAVPKGLSTDPGEKRLAIRTEDHPLEYLDFEGVIPKDEYGGGTVMIWDTGPYRNLLANRGKDSHSMEDSLEDGLIEVWLDGEKLRGGFALKRTEGGKKPRWLAIKMKDEHADARRNPVSTETKSVASGRDLDEIAREEANEQVGLT
jgi:DNA ligase D-like protein (predicted 3'-phosphoesterase)